MAMFKIQDKKLLPVREKDIDLEKDIQRMTEENLEMIFRVQFVSTEFPLQNFRIDTLAFDKESSSFVIIEYKRDRSFSIIDQGYAYLALMLNNKADFILEYNERTGGNLRREDIDWSQSKVLFVAQSFTTYQQNAINFRDLPIELWEVKIFDNSTILYNQLRSPETKESIKTIAKNKTIESVSREIKVYNIEDHLARGTTETKKLFFELRKRILELGEDVKEDPQKFYIAYKTTSNFVDVEIQRRNLKMWLNLKSSSLQDPKGIADDMTNPPRGHYGNGDYEIKISDQLDVPYIFGLIEQAYQASKFERK